MLGARIMLELQKNANHISDLQDSGEKSEQAGEKVMRKSIHTNIVSLAILAALGLQSGIANSAPKAKSARAESPERAQFLSRPFQNEITYFLLPDRFENGDPANDTGGIAGDRLKTGFDPNHKGFFLGGDIKGLINRLDYIKGLGATAIWVAPIFKNKPVQGPLGDESAGYHGYWVTDFTQVDPHFGTNEDFAELVRRAHSMGLKVYMDIIVNHSADVIQYKECPTSSCQYRSKGEYPYGKRGGINGPSINNGFVGDKNGSSANFAKLNDPNYAYTPFVPEHEKNVKVPAWLNNPIYYNNRGDSNWYSEGAVYGDFSGLDDLMTEHPRVINGFIDIFGDWIEKYKVDGFRIDTAKHVNPEFWRKFVPAIEARARSAGVPNFRIFAENAFDEVNPGALAALVKNQNMQSTLDFSFQRAVEEAIAHNSGTEVFDRLFSGDVLYPNGEKTALRLETFISNHDTGRIAMKIKRANPNISEDELQKRVILSHAMLMFLRGSPVIYSGDEQGFVGKGGDQASRQPLFANQVVHYKDDIITGTDKTHSDAHFNPNHTIYQAISQMARIRQSNDVLINGRQTMRRVTKEPGILAISRINSDGHEALLVFNTSLRDINAGIEVEYNSSTWTSLAGNCPSTSRAKSAINLTIPALSYTVCLGNKRR